MFNFCLFTQPMLIAGGEESTYSCNGDDEGFKTIDESAEADLAFDSALKDDKVGRFGGKLAFKALQFLNGTLVSDQETLEMHRLMSLETSSIQEGVMGENDTIVEGKPLELIPLRLRSNDDKNKAYTSWHPRHRSGHRNSATLKQEQADEEGGGDNGAKVRWLQYTCEKTSIPYFYDRKTGEVQWEYPPLDEELMKMETRRRATSGSPKKQASPAKKTKLGKRSSSAKGKKSDQKKKRKVSVDRKTNSPKKKRKAVASAAAGKKKGNSKAPKKVQAEQPAQAVQPVQVYPGFNMHIPNQYYQMQVLYFSFVNSALIHFVIYRTTKCNQLCTFKTKTGNLCLWPRRIIRTQPRMLQPPQQHKLL